MTSLFSNTSYANECGKKNGKVDPDSYELCQENSTVNIYKHVSISDMSHSFVIADNEAGKQAKIDYKSGKFNKEEKVLDVSRLGLSDFIFFAFIFTMVISCFLMLYFWLNSVKSRFILFIAGLLGGLAFLLPSYTNDSQRLVETVGREFTLVGEKIRMKATRKYVYVLTETGTENNSNGEVEINTPITKQLRSITNLVKNYTIMRQTDKVYRNIYGDSEIYYDSKTFIHSTDYGIDFARYKPDNNKEILYSLKPTVFEKIDLSKYGDAVTEQDVNNYVTDDINAMPRVMAQYKQKLTAGKNEKLSSNEMQRVNTQLADFAMLNKNAIRKKMYIDMFPRLEEIYQLKLNYTCYNTGNIQFSKNFIQTSGKDGTPECLYMSGGELKIAADGFDATRFKEKVESKEQIAWAEKIKSLTEALAQEAKSIEDKLSKYSIESVSFNDIDFYVDRVNKGGAFEAILYVDKIAYLSQFKKSFTTAMINDSVYIPVKLVGPAAVDMEILQKESLHGYVSKALNFSIIDKKVESMFNFRDLDDAATSVDMANLTQGFYDASGNANTGDLVKNMLTKPIQSYFARVGIKDGCFSDCVPFTVHPSYALRQTGSEMGILALHMQTASILAYGTQQSINKVFSKDKAGKAGNAELSNNKKSSTGNALSKAVLWLTGLVATLSILPEALSVMLTVVMPMLEKAPFLIGILNYIIFCCLAPILVIVKVINLAIAKKRDMQEFSDIGKTLLSIIFIFLFESWFIFTLYVFSNSVIGTSLWWVALVSNLQMQDASALSQGISFVVLIILNLTVTSVIAVIHFTLIHTIYQIFGFEAVHNKSAGAVNAKFDMLIFRIFPWIYLLVTTIKSLGTSKDPNSKKKEEDKLTDYNTKNS
ncbi:hypothetical protein [Pseudomonas extremaustralis]